MTDQPKAEEIGKLVERLRRSIEQAAVTPGFGNNMTLWQELSTCALQAASALTALVEEREMLKAERDRLRAEHALLQDILDSRPAINAGLPETYIHWSRAVMSGDIARQALGADQ